MYYIKRITLFTSKGAKSNIDLKPGLNIIYGESNTGKSLVLDCIDYLLGAEKHRFDAKLGVKQIMLFLDVDGKTLSLRREIEGKEIEVVSSVNGIDSGIYKLKGKNSINTVWLKLLGIEDDARILQTLEGKTQILTIRTFYHTFMLDETRIQGTASILTAGVGVNRNVGTPTLSSLLYLATGSNYLPDEKKDDRKTRRIKRDAVASFVSRSMSALESKKVSELQNLSKYSPTEIQEKINHIIGEMGSAKGELETALAQSRSLADQIITIDSQIRECRMLKNRNDSLRTQYESDIRRLTFIVEGDFHSEETPVLEICPFCNGQIPKGKNVSCVDAAVGEVQKIEAQINDLLSVQEAIDSEIRELFTEREDAIKSRQNVESVIRGELKPRIDDLRRHLTDYKITLNQYKAKEMIESFSDVLISEFEIAEQEYAEGFKFDARGKMQEVFQSKINQQLKHLLEECNYQNFTGVWFDFDVFDVVVNGHKKKTHGQGFRAYLNTMVALAFSNALVELEHYKYPVLAIDSPILSLKEKNDSPNDELASETMKSGMFNYLIHHQNGPQMIVIENRIPDLDYSNKTV